MILLAHGLLREPVFRASFALPNEMREIVFGANRTHSTGTSVRLPVGGAHLRRPL